MAYDYEKAFALRDDPFKPKQLLSGLTNPPLQDSLEIRPLLINSDIALEFLYSRHAGRFKHYEEVFQDYARGEGYRDDTDPTRVGANSALVSLYGYEGTGKTTLAQAMIRWLRKCEPPTGLGQWYIEDSWSSRFFASAEDQKVELGKLQDKVSKANNRYNCVVVDNLLPGSLNRAVQMYDEIRVERVIFLFLVSKEPELFKELSGEGKTIITPRFNMVPLAADGAVAFVRHRIKKFRLTNDPYKGIPWLAADSLFPFDEADILKAFASGVFLDDQPYISLRQFNRTIAGMLSARLKALDKEFDISKCPEADRGKYVIRLMDDYKELMKVA